MHLREKKQYQLETGATPGRQWVLWNHEIGPCTLWKQSQQPTGLYLHQETSDSPQLDEQECMEREHEFARMRVFEHSPLPLTIRICRTRADFAALIGIMQAEKDSLAERVGREPLEPLDVWPRKKPAGVAAFWTLNFTSGAVENNFASDSARYSLEGSRLVPLASAATLADLRIRMVFRIELVACSRHSRAHGYILWWRRFG